MSNPSSGSQNNGPDWNSEQPRQQPQQPSQQQPYSQQQPQDAAACGYGPSVGMGPAAKQGTSAAAVVGLVLGIIAIATSLVPIVNNLSLFIAFVGFVFSVVGIVKTGKAKPKSGRGIAVAGLVLCIVSVVAVLASQTFYSAVIDEATTEAGLGETRAVENVDQIDIVDVQVNTDYEGKPFLMLTYSWTNSGENTDGKSGPFFTTYSANIYQNGVECESDIYYRQGDSTDYYGDQKEVQVGASQTFVKAYSLQNTSDPVHVTVTGWIGEGNVYLERDIAIQ